MPKMPPKKGGTKRGADAAADASAKKGRRASEADVALRQGELAIFWVKCGWHYGGEV